MTWHDDLRAHLLLVHGNVIAEHFDDDEAREQHYIAHARGVFSDHDEPADMHISRVGHVPARREGIAPSGVLRWEEPPEAYHRAKAREPKRSDHWRRVAAALKERPERWAVVLEGPTFTHTGGIARQIKCGVIAAFRPSGHFEAQTRTTGAGYTVYARYVGEGS